MEEHQDDENGKNHSVNGRVFERCYGGQNEFALIEHGGEFDRRVALSDLVDLRAQAGRNGDDIGIRLSGDRQEYGRRSVETRKDALLFDRMASGGHVAQAERNAVRDGDNGIRDLMGRSEECVGSDTVLVLTDLYHAGRKIHVLVLDARQEHVDRDARCRELVLVGLDHDRSLRYARYADAADAANRGEFVGELIDEKIGEVALGARRIGDLEGKHRRRVRIGLGDLRLLKIRVVGQGRPNSRDLLLYVDGGDVDVGAEFELHPDGREPLERVRFEDVDPRNAAHRVLDRTRHGRFDRFRRDVTITDADAPDGGAQGRKERSA